MKAESMHRKSAGKKIPKVKSSPNSAHAPTKSLEAQLDDIFMPFNRSDAPGLVVGVALHGKTIYRRGFGLASVQHGVANTSATRMRIGSTTKHFTCLAALLLAEDGKLDLDVPATRYLPELPALKGVPTLRQFMTHTSGYRCDLDMGTLANGEALVPPGWSLKALFRQTEVNFAPGQAQTYCNGGYHLLSHAIERAAGMPFEQFLKARIFDPLGMSATAGVPSDMDAEPGMATTHLPNPDASGGGWRRGFFLTDVRGEGNVVSTVDDMLCWLSHMNRPSKQVGSAETWRQMMEPARLVNGLVSVYSLGLFHYLYRGVKVIMHGGSVIGGNSQMLTVPSHGLDIAIMANGALANAAALANKVIDSVLGDEALGVPDVMASTSGFEHMLGTRYHGPSGMLVGFGDVAGKLGISILNNVHLPLLVDRGDDLYVGFEHVALGPYTIRKADLAPGADGGPPETLPFSESGTVEALKRLPAVQPDSLKTGRPLVGHYRSHDLAAEAEVTLEGGTLQIRIRGDYSASRTFKMDAFSKEAFGFSGGSAAGSRYAVTVERKGNRVTGFRVDSIRARHLRFQRAESSA